MFRILIAEDDPSTARLLCAIVKRAGYEPLIAADGVQALELLDHNQIDLLLCDVMMPRMDGFTLTKTIRESGSMLPILMLTAKDMPQDKHTGFIVGTDDYMTKPPDRQELVLRIKALLRRVEMDRGKTAAEEDELHYGDIRYSATENAVFCGSTIVTLTQTELRLLSYMMKQPEKAYSREELLSAVWGFDSEVETRVTDETLRRIRKKLLQAGSTVSVSTIWGFGYKLKGAECT